MPLRTRIILAILLGVVAIGGVFGIIYWLRHKAAPAAAPTVNTPAVIDSTNFVQPTETKTTDIPSGTPIKQPTTLETQQNAAKQAAKIFVERYNSFSTENNYQNIRDVRDLVTDVLWTKISTVLNKPVSGTFMAVSTQAVSASLVTWSDTASDFLVKTRRTVEKNDAETEEYQDVKVSLKKVGTSWLIDSFVVVSVK